MSQAVRLPIQTKQLAGPRLEKVDTYEGDRVQLVITLPLEASCKVCVC